MKTRANENRGKRYQMPFFVHALEKYRRTMKTSRGWVAKLENTLSQVDPLVSSGCQFGTPCRYIFYGSLAPPLDGFGPFQGSSRRK